MEAIGKCHCEEFVTKNEAETEDVAATWAAARFPVRQTGAVVLDGPLGAGKTAWVRGFSRGWGCTTEVSSPTFALVQEYHGGPLPVYHLDFYRLRSAEEVWALGFEDLLATGWVLVEWGMRFPAVFPYHTWGVRLTPHPTEQSPMARSLQIGPWSFLFPEGERP